MSFPSGSYSDFKESVRVATDAALPSYTHLTGVLTATVNGALPNVDGTAMVVRDRVLVKDETAGNAPYNGIYQVTDLGSGGTPWILTRTQDADQQYEIAAAMFVPVEEGTANDDMIFQLTTDNPITLGVTGLTFAEFGGGGGGGGPFVLLAGDTMSGKLTIKENANALDVQNATDTSYRLRIRGTDGKLQFGNGTIDSGAQIWNSGSTVVINDDILLNSGGLQITNVGEGIIFGAGPGTANIIRTGANTLQVQSGASIQIQQDPVVDDDLSRKKYVDDQTGLKVSKTGDTMTGALTNTNDMTSRLGASSQVAIGQLGPVNTAAISFGSAGAEQIYRTSANVLRTDNFFSVGDPVSANGVRLNTFGGILVAHASASILVQKLASSTSVFLGARVTGEGVDRLNLSPEGMLLGGGTLSNDWSMKRVSANTVQLGAGDTIRIQQDPVVDDDLARKAYVDSVGGGGGSSSLTEPDYSADGMGGVVIVGTSMPYSSDVDTSTSSSLADSTIIGFPVWIPEAATMSVVHFHMATNGNYTADNNNKIGIYTATAATTLTLQASTANDGNLWSQGTGWQSKALSAPYAVAQGWVWVVYLRNSSANVTTPTVKRLNSGWLNGATPTAVATPFAAERKRLGFFQGAHTDLPATIDLTAVGSTGNIIVAVLE